MSQINQHSDSEASADSPAPPIRRREQWQRTLARLIGLAWQFRGRAGIALAWAIVVQLLILAGLVYGGLAIDIVRHATTSGSRVDAATVGGGVGAGVSEIHWPLGWRPPDDWSLTAHVAAAAGVILVLTLARAVAGYFARLADEQLIQSIIVEMRVSLYDRLQHMSFAFFDSRDSGGLINRVTNDAGSVRMFIQGVMVRLIVAIASLALFLGYMLSVHVWLTVAVMAVLPLQALVMSLYNTRVEPRFKAQRETMDRLLQFLQESITGAAVVKGFGQEEAMLRRFDARNEEATSTRRTIIRATANLMPLIPATAFGQLAILLAYGGWLVRLGPAAGGIALGAMWVFLSLLRQLSGQIDSIVQTASLIPEAVTGAERVFELLDAKSTITSPTGAAMPAPVKGRITFEHVSFRYGDGPEVLRDINLEIRPGETVALVGPAGGGKTTLLQLVPRFYDPSAGRILIDGVDLRQWPLDALRRCIGVVFQEPFLFSRSIAENVAFSSGDGSASRSEIDAAIIASAADDLVAAAPAGLDAIIGERGLNLSGGERQRLSLARALLASPPILLLDDATASVDARTETRIHRALDRIMHGRTTLIVAHRLSTLRRADRIAVIEGGRITAIGTHDELMAKNAHYRESAFIQLERETAEEQEAGGAGGEGAIAARARSKEASP